MRRRQLPRLLPFLPLLFRTSLRLGSGQPVPLSAEERQLAARVRRLSPSALVVQLQPVDTRETVALAAGCWASDRRLLVHWPSEVLATRDGRARFASWHRSLIGTGLLSVVRVCREVDPREGAVELVHRAG